MTSNISAIAESISANHTVSNKKIQLNPNVQLSCPFPVSEKSKDLSEIYLTPAVNKIERKPITAQYPDDYNIIGIDSTSFTLGTIEDGVVGSIRLSVVSTERNSNKQSLHSYGPYNFPISSDTKQKIFDHLYKQVYNLDPDKKRNSPDAAKMLERIRAVLERYIQMETIGKNSSSIILLDGSFIGGTQDTPMEFMKNLVTCQNDNIPVAIAKETNLTLENGKNILSLLDKEKDPCYIGPINEFIEQEHVRYAGDIYVAKLKTYGEHFRIDLPKKIPISQDKIFGYIAGISGDFGYPEELKLAHSTCVLSSIEILECQTAAMIEYNMKIEQDMHQKLFTPFR